MNITLLQIILLVVLSFADGALAYFLYLYYNKKH